MVKSKSVASTLPFVNTNFGSVLPDVSPLMGGHGNFTKRVKVENILNFLTERRGRKFIVRADIWLNLPYTVKPVRVQFV